MSDVSDRMLPDLPTAVALASIAAHAAEAMSPGGHGFDVQAIESLLSQPNVVDYMTRLREAALLPVPRSHSESPERPA